MICYIKDPAKCSGCGACAQKCPKHCIRLEENVEGFRYPIINKEQCINCGLCYKVCPFVKKESYRVPLLVLAARTKDERVLLESSSGGIFFLLSEYVINKGGVVFGATFDEHWEVHHSFTDTIEGIAKFQRSKYVQSVIGDTYQKVKQFLKDGRTVLFSGTPCQIAGLNKFLKIKYDNLITVDFVCHGVPSPMVWRDYLNEVISINNLDYPDTDSANDQSKISNISFRDKTYGWKRFSLAINAGEEGRIILKEPLDINPYMKAFLNNIILRPSCFNCPFKRGSSGSDITIADFWGGGLFHPSYRDDKGISLIMPYTDIGLYVINQLSFDYELSSYRKALRCNSAIIKSHHKHPNRDIFFKNYKTKTSVIDWILKCDDLSLFDRIVVYLLSLFDRVNSKIRYYVTKD